MNEYDVISPEEELVLVAELASGINCDISGCKNKAINTVIQKFSNGNRLTLNVCNNCCFSLYDPDYRLLFCFGCGNAVWIDSESRHWEKLSKLKNKTSENIIWFQYCNVCYNKEKN
jgi:hypothetical protein